MAFGVTCALRNFLFEKQLKACTSHGLVVLFLNRYRQVRTSMPKAEDEINFMIISPFFHRQTDFAAKLTSRSFSMKTLKLQLRLHAKKEYHCVFENVKWDFKYPTIKIVLQRTRQMEEWDGQWVEEVLIFMKTKTVYHKCRVHSSLMNIHRNSLVLNCLMQRQLQFSLTNSLHYLWRELFYRKIALRCCLIFHWLCVCCFFKSIRKRFFFSHNQHK